MELTLTLDILCEIFMLNSKWRLLLPGPALSEASSHRTRPSKLHSKELSNKDTATTWRGGGGESRKRSGIYNFTYKLLLHL